MSVFFCFPIAIMSLIFPIVDSKSSAIFTFIISLISAFVALDSLLSLKYLFKSSPLLKESDIVVINSNILSAVASSKNIGVLNNFTAYLFIISLS